MRATLLGRHARAAHIVSDMEPPVADRRPVTTEHHGRTRVDEYEWLRAKDDPEVDGVPRGRERLHRRSAPRTWPTCARRSSTRSRRAPRRPTSRCPTRNRGYWYYGRSFEGKRVRRQLPRPGRATEDDWTPPQPAEDVAPPTSRRCPARRCCSTSTTLAEGHEFFSLGGSSVSPDTHLLAYSTDIVGDERYTVRVKDLPPASCSPTRSPASSAASPGTRDGQDLFYTTVDDAWRPDKVWRHRLGTEQADDELVFHETDGRFWVGVGRTRTDRFLVIAAGSKTTTEYRFLDADRPDAGFRVFAARAEGLEYGLEHAVIAGEDVFLVLHNHTGADFELGTAPVAPTPPEDWRPLVAARPGRPPRGRRRVRRPPGGAPAQRRPDPAPDPRARATTASGDDYLVEFDQRALHRRRRAATRRSTSPTVRLGYTSMAIPASVYDYDVRTRDLTLLQA